MVEVLTVGSTIKCDKAIPPGVSVLVGFPSPASASMMPVLSVMMNKPIVNIVTFGMCNSKTNPAVIAGTAAAQGVHTPMPCLPVIVAPWDNGASNITVGGIQAATKDSTCKCAWGGSVSVVNSLGQPMKNG